MAGDKKTQIFRWMSMRFSGLPRSQAPRSSIQLLTAISIAELYEKANPFNETPINNFDQSKTTPKNLTINLMFLQNWLDYRALTKIGLIVHHWLAVQFGQNMADAYKYRIKSMHHFKSYWAEMKSDDTADDVPDDDDSHGQHDPLCVCHAMQATQKWPLAGQ